MPVSRAQREITAREFAEWLAVYRIERMEAEGAAKPTTAPKKRQSQAEIKARLAPLFAIAKKPAKGS